MKEIPVGNDGLVAYVDDEDFELVSPYTWYVHADVQNSNSVYAYGFDNGAQIIMHCLITGIKGVDHKDGNGLNNVRSNLRPATPAQNTYNRRKLAKASSKYKGVTWYARTGKWRAQANKDGQKYHLGYFADEVEAARAYDRKALELFGEYAKPNFEGR